MKKPVKIIVLCLVAFIVLIIAVLSVMKSKVTTLIEEEVDSYAEYNIKYDEIKVSVLRHFPSLSVSLNEFSMQQQGEMTLSIPEFSGRLSFAKVLKNELEIVGIEFVKPQLDYTSICQSGDEYTPTSTSVSEPETITDVDNATFFSSLKIKSFKITEGYISYKMMDSVVVTLDDINWDLSGQLDDNEAAMNSILSVNAVNYEAPGFSIKNTALAFEAQMLYKLQTGQLLLNNNVLTIGDFSTTLVGEVLVSEQPDFDLSFEAPKTEIKSVLALMPKTLIKDANALETNGNVSLNGFVKGKYKNADSWPAFGINFKVENAWFKYKELSGKVDEIKVIAQVTHPAGTTPDSTVISIEELSMQSGDNRLNADLDITTPVSNIAIKGNVKSNLNLEELKNTIPMKASDIVGKITADVNFDGKLADIEQENYKDFNASGHLSINEYYVQSKAIPQGLSINKTVLQFTPERINISSFSGKLGSNDIYLSGYLSNYFAYLFDNKTLNGVLKLNSNNINFNEFMAHNAQQSSTGGTTTPAEKSLFIVPSRYNIDVNSAIRRARLDNVILSNVKGKISIIDSKILLDNLGFNTLDGTVNITGEYNSQNPDAVYTDMDLKVKNMEISKAAKTISVFRKMLPASQTMQGKLSSEMHYYARFDNKGEVDLNSIKSKGYLASPGVRIANNEELNSLAKQLNDPRYRDFTTSAIHIDYTMENGKLILTPFDVKVIDRNINAGGWYNLDNKLSFRIKTTVKAKEIGGDVSKYISMVSNPNKPLPVTIKLSGDAANPDVKFDTSEAISILRKDVTKSLKEDGVNNILKSLF